MEEENAQFRKSSIIKGVMKLAPNLQSLENALEAKDEAELRDQFANAYYLHQPPQVSLKIQAFIKGGLRVTDAYRKVALAQMEEEEKEAFAQVAFGYGLDQFNELNPVDITNLPYYKLLMSLEEKRFGKIRFFTRRYAPYEVFLSKEQYYDEGLGTSVLPLGYYKEGLSFPAVEKKGRVWMSLIPHEIETMKEPIAKAKGSVLVLGIGLGYYAYEVSNKEDVTRVTLVENDPEVIAFFKDALLPHFPHKEKIEIIEGDGIAYMASKQSQYDFAFVDIYHNEEDGLPLYLRLLSKQAIPTTYWIESSLLLYFRRYLIAFLQEQYEGYTAADYQNEDGFDNSLFAHLYRLTKQISIESEEDLENFLSADNVAILAMDIAKAMYHKN